jgi:hypothetical protein
MNFVYVCFDEDYVTAVFDSREVAEKYSKDVREFELGHDLPVPATRFTLCGIYPANSDVESSVYSPYWREGLWSVRLERFASDSYEAHLWRGESVSRYSRTAAYVEVRGDDLAALRQRFAVLQKEIEARKS